MVSKVDDIRHKLLGAISHEDWCHFVDDLIFAVREECAEATQLCTDINCRHGEMEILMVCDTCGRRTSFNAYGFEACARVKP